MFYVTVLKPIRMVPRSPVGGSLLPKIGNATGALQLGFGITIPVGETRQISSEAYNRHKFVLIQLFETGFIEMDREMPGTKVKAEPESVPEAPAPVVPEPEPEEETNDAVGSPEAAAEEEEIPETEEDFEPVDPMTLKKAELQALCDEHAVVYLPSDTKAQLIELLNEAGVE